MPVLLEQQSDAAARGADRSAMEGLVRAVVVDMILLVTAVIVLHLSVAGPIPSGGDGGNWLALAREMLGESVMSADVTYEPVFIGLVAALIPVLGHLGALVFAAWAAEIVLVTAIYIIVRRAGRIPALISAGTVLLLGYRLEAYAWGAYPQLLGLGVGLLTTWALLSYFDSPNRRLLIGAIGGCLVTFLTHKLVGVVLLGAVPAAAAHLYWQRRWGRPVLRRALFGVGIVAGIGLLFASMWWASTSEGMEPTLNPLGHTLAEQLSTVFLGSEVPWIVVGALALVGLGMRSWDTPQAVLAAAGFGWLASSVAAFLVSGEARTLLQAQVALIPVAVVVARRPLRGTRVKPRRIAAFAATVALAALFGSLVLTGLSRYEQSTDWYRVVGQNELAALDQLDELAGEDNVVVASRGPNGNPIGWWVEGYAGIPTYTSVDLGFLAFPDEREQAAAAAAIFEASPVDAAAALDELGADLILFDRRGPDSGWLGGGDPIGLEVISDGTLLIMGFTNGP